ncbi:MAG: glycosyltransferase [Anaerorhabdus sp.]|uniref:glycosyltransferase n=1 Tax=Anaerorhabdus sp. TaxID=1872524 RepID=UPI002FC74238
MKKKILFMIGNLNVGGVQKSLLSLLHYFDYEKYDVSLLILENKNIFIDKVPPEVNVMTDVFDDSIFHKPINSITNLINNKKYKYVVLKIFQLICQLFNKGIGALILSKIMIMQISNKKFENDFDVAIDYGGQQILYFMVDYINASKKVTYFHNDYAKWDYYYLMDRKYYKKVDYIVTVSDLCAKSLFEYFPQVGLKIKVIENIVDFETMELYSEQINFHIIKNCFTIMTTGRVCQDKGVDIAIEAARILKSKKIQFKWYWIGPGSTSSYDYSDIESSFEFLGMIPAPFQVLKYCDLYVQPSRFEGKAMTIEEAKILGIPIIATKFSTVDNQITENVNGFICEINAESVAETIENFIKQRHPLKFPKNAGNKEEIEKLYALIEA